MGKSLKVIKPKDRSTDKKSALIVHSPESAEQDMELLIRDRSSTRSHKNTGIRVKLHLILLLIGVLGSSLCLWTMVNTAESQQKAQSLGLHRVAGSLENILSLLAYPVLMFLVILAMYAAQQLYRAYRIANDPETYRRDRNDQF